jgi:hypothetical protein
MRFKSRAVRLQCTIANRKSDSERDFQQLKKRYRARACFLQCEATFLQVKIGAHSFFRQCIAY